MVDYRNEFVQAVKIRLSTMVDADVAESVVDVVTYEIAKYDLSKITTELAVYDDSNEKMIKSFMACMVVEGRSKKTIKAYRYSINKFFRYVGNKPYDQVTAFDIRAWLASMKISGCKSISIRNEKNNLTTFFNWLFGEGIIEKNPCTPIRPIKVEQEEKSCFSSEEIDTIRSACNNTKQRAIIETLLSSGLRVSELCNLKMDDVDFNSLTVRVRCGKGGKDRTTFINPVAKKYICRYLSERKSESEYVFTSRYGKQYSASGIQRIMVNMSEKCGFHIHPHRFRRTLASDLARKGMPIQEIQKLLGHTSIETTRRYTDTKIDQVQASYRQFIA